jgi:hypothetical protein
MNAWEFVSNPKNEANAKLLFLYCAHTVSQPEFENDKTFATDADDLSSELGLSKAQIWRAQSILKKAGVLKITPSYCKDTGKKEFDTYEIVFDVKTEEII